MLIQLSVGQERRKPSNKSSQTFLGTVILKGCHGTTALKSLLSRNYDLLKLSSYDNHVRLQITVYLSKTETFILKVFQILQSFYQPQKGSFKGFYNAAVIPAILPCYVKR